MQKELINTTISTVRRLENFRSSPACSGYNYSWQVRDSNDNFPTSKSVRAPGLITKFLLKGLQGNLS